VSFLVDTNAFSELRKGRRGHPNFYSWSRTLGWSALYTSWIVIAETKRGVELIRRRDKAQAVILEAWLTELLERMRDRILPVDRAVAEICADLMVPNPRPPFDALIAATAHAHGLTLVTCNVRDFANCGISLLDPWTGVSR
jgi:predicted nucleic acid-binding protein